MRADGVTSPINIGNPAEFSIRELAEIVIDVTGSPSKIVSRPLPADDPRQRQPDIAKARHVLGWTQGGAGVHHRLFRSTAAGRRRARPGRRRNIGRDRTEGKAHRLSHSVILIAETAFDT
jgi:UDP-glucose 4-epimerase